MICAECQKNVCFLKNHIKKNHDIALKDYYIKHICKIHPVCMCGCNQLVNFSDRKFLFRKFIRGHEHVGRKKTEDHKRKIGLGNKGKQRSNEMKEHSRLKAYEVRDKTVETLKKRYNALVGFNVNLTDKQISERARKAATGESRKKINLTNFNRYGVFEILSHESIRRKTTSKEVCEKRIQTMKSNKTFHTSRAEIILFTLLKEKFGENDIEDQKICNGWPIDFFVKSLNLYIQVDGVYWHGLNRPIEIIMNSTNVRDRQILKKIEIDKRQNEWFAKNNLCLMRLTDLQIISKSFKLEEILCSMLSY